MTARQKIADAAALGAGCLIFYFGFHLPDALAWLSTCGGIK